MDPAPPDPQPSGPEPSEQDAAPDDPIVRIGLLDVLAAYLVGLGASVAATVAWVALIGPGSDTGLLAVASAGLWVGFVGGPVTLSRGRGTGSIVRDFGLRPPRPGVAVTAVAVGVLVQALLVPLLYWILGPLLDARALGDPARALNEQAGSTLAFVVLTVVVVVGAPIAEELFFRGMLQRALRRRMAPAPAIVVTALAFGLSHFETVQLPALVGLGLVLGWMAHRTGTLAPAILAHSAFNAVTMAMLAASR